MKLSLCAGPQVKSHGALPAIFASLVALSLAGCSESGGGGNTGGSGGGTASGGAGGATSTETYGCPASEPPPNTPCYEKGKRCNLSIPTQCGQWGYSLDCYSWSDYWQLTHWDNVACTCPETIPADGDPCDPAVVAASCKYTVTADCGEVEIVATCTAYQAENKGWSVPTAVCP